MSVVVSAAVPAQSSAPAEETLVPVLDFVGPVAGFAAHRAFVLTEIDPASIMCAMRAVDDPDVRFLVIPPGPFFPDYAPEISDDWASTLELTSAEDALVLVIVNPGTGVVDATVNLLAPIVINTVTLRAAQVVLDADLPLRSPLPVN